MRRLVGCVAAVALASATLTLVSGSAGALKSTTYTHGYDVSWPQCSGGDAHHMPSSTPSFMILGLTDGAGHTINPCLPSQLAWARAHHVKVGAYLVPSYPTFVQRVFAGRIGGRRCDDLACRLRNDGAMQVKDALATMRVNGMRAPMVWLDVEFRHVQRWSAGRTRNREVLEGAVRALRHAHKRFGVYSTSYMWDHITGGYPLDVPNWLPSGDGRAHNAKRMCSTTATGGPTWIVQYTRRLDSDLTCPVLDPAGGHHIRMWRYRHSTVRLWDSGPAVRIIQRRLHIGVNGTYGFLTAAAVRGWQLHERLRVTGIFRPRDWRALGAFRRYGGHGFRLARVVGQA